MSGSNRKHEMLEELNIILCAVALRVCLCVCACIKPTQGNTKVNGDQIKVFVYKNHLLTLKQNVRLLTLWYTSQIFLPDIQAYYFLCIFLCIFYDLFHLANYYSYFRPHLDVISTRLPRFLHPPSQWFS